MITLKDLCTPEEIEAFKNAPTVQTVRESPAEVLEKAFIEITVGDIVYLNQFNIFKHNYSSELIADLYKRFEVLINKMHRQ